MPFDATPVTNSVIERLRAGRARIEAGWCTGIAQRVTKTGVDYCAVGAVAGECPGQGWPAIGYLGRALPPGYRRIPDYNDSHTKADILALYDRAIDLAVQDQLANGGK